VRVASALLRRAVWPRRARRRALPHGAVASF